MYTLVHACLYLKLFQAEFNKIKPDAIFRISYVTYLDHFQCCDRDLLLKFFNCIMLLSDLWLHGSETSSTSVPSMFTTQSHSNNLTNDQYVATSPLTEQQVKHHWLWPPYGTGQAIIFLPVVSSIFYLSSFFRRPISTVADWMSTILLHVVWP